MTDITAEQAALLLSLGLGRDAMPDPLLEHADTAELAAALAFWEDQLAVLDRALPETPPAALRDAVLARVRSMTQDAAAVALPNNSYTQYAAESTYVEIARGVRVRELFTSGARTISLVVMDPGAVYDSHPHEHDEECYVISGDLSFGSLHLASGDFHLARRGSTHERATTHGGCMLYIAS